MRARSSRNAKTSPVAPAESATPPQYLNLKAWRLRVGITIKQMAGLLQVNPAVVQKQEKETANVRITELRAWQRALGVSLSALINDQQFPTEVVDPQLHKFMTRIANAVVEEAKGNDNEQLARMAERLVGQIEEIRPALDLSHPLEFLDHARGRSEQQTVGKRVLHEIRAVRLRECKSIRFVARHTNQTCPTVKLQEIPSTDLTMSVLVKLANAIAVPLIDLLDAEEESSKSNENGGKLLRIMKTLNAMIDLSPADSIRGMVDHMRGKLIAIMPKLQEVNPWLSTGTRRRPDDVGPRGEYVIPVGDMEGMPQGSDEP